MSEGRQRGDVHRVKGKSGENDERLTEDGRSGTRSEGKDGHMDVILVPTPDLESRDGVGFLTLRGDVSRRGWVRRRIYQKKKGKIR